MEINKIEQIATIFNLHPTEITYLDRRDNFFTISFSYKNFHIEVHNSSDYIYENYYDITIKKNIVNYECIETSFAMLLAYYDEEAFNLKYTINNMIKSFLVLKQYIDGDKLFFECVDLNSKQRFINIDGILKELPFITNSNYELEAKARYGDNYYKIINNQPIYK